jgi:putative hydrolase of the HAD superfamily
MGEKQVTKLLIFDLDDTLVVEEASAREAFMEVCRQAEEACGVKAERLYESIRESARSIWHKSPARQYCLEIGISSWEGLWARFEGEDANLKILREWSPSYRVDSWNNALIQCGITNKILAAQLAAAFHTNRRKYHVLFDDARSCLEELSKLYSLALITNGAPDLQREKIKATGINGYFKKIIVSGEIGYGKPDSRIFQRIMAHFKEAPEHVWSIGDSLERDIQGAKILGIKTAWVNRRQITRNDQITPDLEISNLKQLAEALRNQLYID